MKRNSVWFATVVGITFALWGLLGCEYRWTQASSFSLEGSVLVNVTYGSPGQLQEFSVWWLNYFGNNLGEVWFWIIYILLLNIEGTTFFDIEWPLNTPPIKMSSSCFWLSVVLPRKCLWAFCISFGTLSSSQPEGHYMPLENADWKIRSCRNLSVYLHFLHPESDASVK